VKNLFLVIILLSATFTFAQFRDSGFETNSVKEGIITENSNALFGFLNSDDFIMRHSFSLNYATSSGQGMSLTSYTNSMFYRLMNNLNVQLDVSVMYSPYSTLASNFRKISPEFI